MKKFLLPLLAVGMAATPVFAQDEYGTTPETAKPFPSGAMGWTVPDGVPDEVWFTLTNPETVPAVLNMSNAEAITIYFKGGLEAFKWNGFTVLMPGEEYLMKIKHNSSLPPFYTPTGPGGKPYMTMPESATVAGSAAYCPINRTNEWGGTSARTVEPGATIWMYWDVDHPTQLSVTKNAYDTSATGDLSKVTTMHVYHIDGTGDYQEEECGVYGGPYVKKGRNIVGISYAETATEPLQFLLNGDPNMFACGYRLERATKMALDQAVNCPDGYSTTDKLFVAPEDGDYTVINQSAAGTILTVGSIAEYVEDLGGGMIVTRYNCDFEGDVKTATVGNDAAKVVISAKKGDKFFIRSDAFVRSGATTLEGRPYIKVVNGDQTGIADVMAEEGNTIKATMAGGKLNVESVLLASGAEVAVYDMLARKVASADAANGAASLEMDLDVAPGVYVVVVYGKGNSESAKISVK